MKLKNTDTSWGLISILVHWVAAIVIIALFASGLWMMDLGYGSPWYQKAPHWHKSVGVLIISLMIFRYLWKLFSGSPAAIANHKPWEKKTLNNHTPITLCAGYLNVHHRLFNRHSGRQRIRCL